jgi:hypothetical protein
MASNERQVRPEIWKRVCFLAPFAGMAVWLALKKIENPIYYRIVREDNVLEWAQFLFFGTASVFAGATAIRFARMRRPVYLALYAALSVALLFVAGEEISWGQRIFGFPVNDFFRTHNVQKEITLHNLDGIQNHLLIPLYIAAGLFGTSAWLVARKLRPGFRGAASWVVPDWYLAPYFLPVLLIYVYFQLGVFAYWHGLDAFPIGGFVKWNDQEPAELAMSAGLLLFTISRFRRAAAANPPGSA